ncbi:MAG: MaoC family dehydratase N-terminal domain-containing protein [Chloroflexi bacterium]|nr:MaoC family dehydratase N-terminal domain-containing protein [Chloroflexota bacterium]
MTTNQPYYEDVEPGDEVGPLLRTSTRDQVRAYAAVGGVNPTMGRFVSDEAARTEGLQGMIVPGNLCMAFLSQLFTDWAGPQGRLRKLEVNFRRMVQPDDQLTCQGIVIDKDVVDHEGQVRVDVSLENQRGEKPVIGTAVVILPQRG